MLHAEATRRQGRVRELKGCIIGDVETPIVVQFFGVRGVYIAFSDGDELRDFGAARLVGFQPPELLPIL